MRCSEQYFLSSAPSLNSSPYEMSPHSRRYASYKRSSNILCCPSSLPLLSSLISSYISMNPSTFSSSCSFFHWSNSSRSLISYPENMGFFAWFYGFHQGLSSLEAGSNSYFLSSLEASDFLRDMLNRDAFSLKCVGSIFVGTSL